MTPVNLMNYRAERTADGTDWILYGDITDNNNNVLEKVVGVPTGIRTPVTAVKGA